MVPLVKISLWDYKSIAKQLVFLKATSRSQNRRVWPLRYVLTSKLEELALFDQLVKERAEISANFAFLIFKIR